MSDVLLTYGWVRSSYSALRNLKKHNLQVFVSDSSCIGMSQFSKFSSGFKKYTSHYENENKFISDILDICSSQEIKLILPSHNETEIIARHRYKFSDDLVAIIPDESHCRMFNNKSDAYDYVSNIAIPVPGRIKYADPNLISQLLMNKTIEKTVIKLLTGNSSKGVFYGNSYDNHFLVGYWKRTYHGINGCEWSVWRRSSRRLTLITIWHGKIADSVLGHTGEIIRTL